jgi:O-antigen ligase
MLHLAAVVVIVLAMSPATRNLDNIKMALYLVLGPVVLVVALGEMALGRLRRPPVFLVAALAAYFIVSLLSFAFSKYRWVGYPELLFLWASFGFCLGGFAHGVSARGTRVLLLSMTGLLFLVNLLGFFQFDVFGTGSTGVRLLQRLLGGDPDPGASATGLQTLLHTFSASASTSLMSTILNRDFYAAFCLLFLAFPIALALLTDHKGLRLWAAATSGLSVLSIMLCQSKGEYIALGVFALVLPALLAMQGRPLRLWRGYGSAWLLGTAMLTASFMIVRGPMLGAQLKSLHHSVQSRLIIHAGAYRIFQDFPLLGGGPGTFRIYFPEYRSPDYFDWGISNLTNFSHNFVLDLLSETGVLGLLAAAAIVAPMGIRVILRSRDDREGHFAIPAACLTAALLAFLISNLTSVSSRWPIGAVGMWSVIGVLYGLLDASHDRPLPLSPPVPRRWLPVESMPALMALFGLTVLMSAPAALQARTYWRSQRAFADGFLLAEQYRDFAIQRIYAGRDLSPPEHAFLVDRLGTAAAHLRRALDIDPNFASALYHLGSTESLLAGLAPERVDEHLHASIGAYTELARLAPDYAELPYNLGIAHLQFARRLREELHALPPGAAAERDRIELDLGRHQAEALGHFERMGRLSNRAEVLLNLGEAYHGAGRPDLTMGVYRRGAELHPDDVRFPRRMIPTAAAAGDVEAGVEARFALWRHEPLRLDLLLGDDGALELSLRYELREEFDEIIGALLERYPVDAEVYAIEARAADQWNDAERLSEALRNYRALGGAAGEILGLEGKAGGDGEPL